MAHTPINHHLRPLYRAVAGFVGLFVLVFGIVGFVKTRGTPLFAQDGLPWVTVIPGLGLRTNLAFALLSVVAGAVLLGGAAIGRNVDHIVNLVAGWAFIGAGLVMMALMQTPNGNFLGFSMSTCNTSFVLGMLLLTAGLYGKVGTDADVEAEEAYRHGTSAAH